MSDDRQRCLEAGCDDHMSKPVDREKLLAVVAQHSAKGEAAAL
jgi:CheY-like chemotaxis protein